MLTDLFPNSRPSTKMTLRPLNVALLDVAISEELWGQAELSVPPSLPSSGASAHAMAQQNNRAASSVPGKASHSETYSTSWWWDLVLPLIVIYWAGWGHQLRHQSMIIPYWWTTRMFPSRILGNATRAQAPRTDWLQQAVWKSQPVLGN